MKRLVFFPSDPVTAYLEVGLTYDYLDNYYNPGGYFDEVFCLSPWGDKKEEKIGKITYIRSNPCKFKKIIKKIKPDVVRGYGGYCCADWISISKVKNIPSIVSVHDTNPLLIHDTLQYADYIVCMAECVKEAVLKKIRFDPNKIWVMPNRINVDLFSKKENIDFFEKLNNRFGVGKHILHVGRKTEQKNLDTIIKALKYMDNSISSIFVGRGDCTKYEKIAKEYGVRERCFFVESVDNNELPYWYSWCDCFCTPSRWEGFGFVFIEAASCEAGIVTSNIAPMNEYLTDGVNAILVDEYENPHTLAQAINLVINGGDKISKMKSEARKVGFQFAKEKVDKEEIKIYKDVINLGSVNQKKNKSLKIRFKTWKQYK